MKRKHDTQAAMRERKARAKEKRLEAEHFGLSIEQRRHAEQWPLDVLALMTAAAMANGLGVSSPGRQLAQLEAIGFLKIEANGHRHSVAKVTLDGYKALVLRLRRSLPRLGGGMPKELPFG